MVENLPTMGAPQLPAPAPQVETTNQDRFQVALQKLILSGDLRNLTESERAQYYRFRCEQLSLDWASQPFELIILNGKMVLYLKAGGAYQLSQKNKITYPEEPLFNREDDVLTCKVKAVMGERETWAIGAVTLEGLKLEAKANAYMKAHTKAQRRAIIALLGIGVSDESEVIDIPGAIPVDATVLLDEPKPLTLQERLQRCVASFKELGVSEWAVETKVKKLFSEFTEDDLAALGAIYDAIANGEPVEQHFPKGSAGGATATSLSASREGAPAAQTAPAGVPIKQVQAQEPQEKKPRGGAKSANNGSVPPGNAAPSAQDAAGGATTSTGTGTPPAPGAAKLSDDSF